MGIVLLPSIHVPWLLLLVLMGFLSSSINTGAEPLLFWLLISVSFYAPEWIIKIWQVSFSSLVFSLLTDLYGAIKFILLLFQTPRTSSGRNKKNKKKTEITHLSEAEKLKKRPGPLVLMRYQHGLFLLPFQMNSNAHILISQRNHFSHHNSNAGFVLAPPSCV